MKFHQILIEKLSLNPVKLWKNTRRKNMNKQIFAQLNINSQRNKSESLQHMIMENAVVLLISETKIDSALPSVRFHLKLYASHTD